MRRVLFFFLLPLLMVSCKGEPGPAADPVRPVKTIVATAHSIGKQWTFSGTAEDALEADLSFRVGGKIIEFPGDQIGRRFSKGAVIARLDPADYELQVRQAKANLEQIRANYQRSSADVARIRELYSRRVISKSELDQAEAEYESYSAQLLASEKQLDIARKHLNYTTLHAPFDGWISNVTVNIHQNVNSGQPVVSFNAGRQMKMYISVPDTLIAEIEEGEIVEVRFDALPGDIMMGKVMEVGVGTNQGSTYPVKVYLDNNEKRIRSGMSGHVTFVGKSSGKEHVFVPPVAVASTADGTRSVWVVDRSDSTVHRHEVQLGPVTEFGVRIDEGLSAGDIVVVRGVHHLSEGLKVRFDTSGSED